MSSLSAFRCTKLAVRRSQTAAVAATTSSSSRWFPPSTAFTRSLSMKPGTPIPGLDIYKEKDPPVVMERSEYPDWVNDLATPLVSLAKLRKMTVEEATDREKKRYLKLIRRNHIKEKNEEQAKT